MSDSESLELAVELSEASAAIWRAWAESPRGWWDDPVLRRGLLV